MLPEFVIDALAETAKGKGRDDLLCSQRRVHTSDHPRQRSPGYPVRLLAARRPTRPSRV